MVRCSTETTFICTKRLVCIQDRKETQIGQKWIQYKQVRSWTRHSHLIWFNARTGSLMMTPDVLELMMMREKVGFIENTARRHRWGG